MFKKCLLSILLLFPICVSVQAQSFKSEVGIHSVYMPKFKVREASGRNLQAIGLRWMVSSRERKVPFELGVNFSIGYDDVASASYSINLAYIFGEPNATNVKLGFGLGGIDLLDVDADKSGFGPHVGDVTFESGGTQFKPYVEFECEPFRFASLFVRTGYRIINGGKTTITSVKKNTDGPTDTYQVRDDYTFFYSGAGFELGFGVSIIIFRH